MYARESRFRDKKVLLAVWCTHDALYECSAGTYRADEQVNNMKLHKRLGIKSNVHCIIFTRTANQLYKTRGASGIIIRPHYYVCTGGNIEQMQY